MTPDEKKMLDSLASRVANTPVSQKDPEADALIRQRLGSNPDALYVLTQTVLIQDIALNQAKAQIEELRQRIAAHTGSSSPHSSEPHTSFLGRIFGTGAPAQSQAPGPGQPAQNRPPSYNPPAYEGYPPAAAPSQGSSFLRSAATTAAGVAAGALAFEGIQSLFGHGGGFGGLGGSGLGGSGFGSAGMGGQGFLDRPVEETTINNYYDSPPDDDTQSAADAADDSSSDDPDTDTSDFDDSSGSTDSVDDN